MEENNKKIEAENENKEEQQEDTKKERKPSRPTRSFDRNDNRRRFVFKKKVCFFCKNKDAEIDYKNADLMRRYISESGKISPRRFTGTCAKHQRRLTKEIKKARQMALIPYTDKH